MTCSAEPSAGQLQEGEGAVADDQAEVAAGDQGVDGGLPFAGGEHAGLVDDHDLAGAGPAEDLEGGRGGAAAVERLQAGDPTTARGRGSGCRR